MAHAPEIAVDLGPEIIRGHLLESSEEAVPRIIDKHVKAPKSIHPCSDCRHRLLRVRDIERNRPQPLPMARLEVVERFRPPRGRDDAIALLQRGLGKSTAQAA